MVKRLPLDIGTLVLLALTAGWSPAARAEQSFIVVDDALSDGVELRRGELAQSPADQGVGRMMIRRDYAPDAGTWDQVQVYWKRPLILDGPNPRLSLHVNVVPKAAGTPARIRQIELLVADGVGKVVFAPDKARYAMDGLAQLPGQFLNFDRDPGTWQQLTLDLTSGPGLSPTHRIVRLAIQFTDDSTYAIANVRFDSGNDSSATSVTSATAASSYERQPGDHTWPWVTSDAMRVMVRCEPYPGAGAHQPAWTAIDFVGMMRHGALPPFGWNPDSVRVIEYDPRTRRPVSQRPGEGVESLLVPCKVERWPMLPIPYDKAEHRRPIQVSWLRRPGGPKDAVYGIYFDERGKGETVTLPTPAFIGTGDALAFGGELEPSPVRGIPVPIDWDGDGVKDLIGMVHTTPDRGMYLYRNQGTNENPVLGNPYYLRHPNIRNAPQVDDIDGDGKLDIGCMGGYFSNVGERGLDEWIAVKPPSSFTFKQVLHEHRVENWSFHDLDGDGVRDLIVGVDSWHEYGWDNAFNRRGEWTRGPMYGWFYFFKNLGNNRDFILDRPVRLTTTDGQSINVYGNPTPVMLDIDGDGDLDLVSGDFLGGLFIFQNVGSATHPQFTKAVPVQTTGGSYRAMRQANTPVATDWNDDGHVDLLLRNEAAQVTLLQNTGRVQDGVPVFEPERTLTCTNDRINVGQLPANDLCDWDGDGDPDLIYGDSSGFFGWYENTGSTSAMKFASSRLFTDPSGEPIRIVAGPSGSIQGPAEGMWGYTVPDAGDWDLDGKPDLMFNSIWGLVQWMPNPGSGGGSYLQAPVDVRVEWPNKPLKPVWQWWDPEPGQWATQWRCTVRMIDWNNDGLPDVVSLDTEGYLVLHERYREADELKLGPPRRVFLDEQGKPFRANQADATNPGSSGRMKFDLADWDGDGDRDLVMVTPTYMDRANVLLYENVGTDAKPRFANRGDIADVVLRLHTCSPTIFDYDGDGRPDLLIGAEDGHFYAFHRDYLDHKARLEAKPLASSTVPELAE